MKAIRKLTVRTTLPERLASLETLATNLRWSWHQPTRELFRDLSVEGWRETGHDPVQLLGWIGTEQLEELADDPEFVARVDALSRDLDDYLAQARWYQSLDRPPTGIGYFSPEFGITSALPQYSGGLGILAGDHLKTASDIGGFLWSASACSIRTATSSSGSRVTAGRTSSIRCTTPTPCR